MAKAGDERWSHAPVTVPLPAATDVDNRKVRPDLADDRVEPCAALDSDPDCVAASTGLPPFAVSRLQANTSTGASAQGRLEGRRGDRRGFAPAQALWGERS